MFLYVWMLLIDILHSILKPLCCFDQVKASDEAVILCKTSIGSLKLDINDLPATKVFFFLLQTHFWGLRLTHVKSLLQKLIEEVEEMLNNLPGVTSVHGRFYDLSSKYYRIIGNHAMYYRDALRYLGCVEAKDLPGTDTSDTL